MQKLRLMIEQLQVESFPTTPGQKTPRGTVFGRQTQPSACGPTAYTECWGLCGGSGALACTYDANCLHSIDCDTGISDCEGRSCQLSCESCDTETCAGATCVGDTCGLVGCNPNSVEPYCYG